MLSTSSRSWTTLRSLIMSLTPQEILVIVEVSSKVSSLRVREFDLKRFVHGGDTTNCVDPLLVEDEQGRSVDVIYRDGDVSRCETVFNFLAFGTRYPLGCGVFADCLRTFDTFSTSTRARLL